MNKSMSICILIIWGAKIPEMYSKRNLVHAFQFMGPILIMSVGTLACMLSANLVFYYGDKLETTQMSDTLQMDVPGSAGRLFGFSANLECL